MATLYELFLKLFPLLVLCYLLACPVCSAMLAVAKGRDGVTWFLIGLMFGPFGLVAAAGVPAVANYETRKALRGLSGQMKLCDYCVEAVRAEASVCPHCTSTLIEGEEKLEPA
jgi:hypothetical protein